MNTDAAKHWEYLRLVTPGLIAICLFMLNSIWGSLKEVQSDQAAIRERLVMIETTVQMQNRRK